MLDDLVETVELIKSRILNHRIYFSEGRNSEWRTRIGLVDPILNVLGWDVSDPELVEIEPKTTAKSEPERWPDYALLGENGKRRVFIEAKKLSDSDLSVVQVIGYAFQESVHQPASQKINLVIATNGDIWRVYTVSESKLELEIHISKEDTEKCALRFLSLWRNVLLHGRITEVSDVKLTTTAPPTDLPSQSPGIALSDSNLNPTGRKPTALQFPNNQERQIQSWRDVLKEVVVWLHQNSLLNVNIAQSVGSSKKYRIAKNGSDMRYPMSIQGTDYYVEGNLSAVEILKYATALIQHSGANPTHFKVTLTK